MANRNALLLLATAVLVAGCFPKTAGPRLDHFALEAPGPGQLAPDFELRDLDGKTVALSQLIGERPLVLQFGSHTCPVYRYRRHSMRPLVEDYRDRVHFLLVYTLEAHPAGSRSPYADREWRSLVNRITRVKLDQPVSDDERVARAEWSWSKLTLDYPMVVDSIDNHVWQLYGSASSPAFVIDREGRVALAQVWVDPRGIRETLDRLLPD